MQEFSVLSKASRRDEAMNVGMKHNRGLMADLMFATSRETILQLLVDEKYLGAVPGIISALHARRRPKRSETAPNNSSLYQCHRRLH